MSYVTTILALAVVVTILLSGCVATDTGYYAPQPRMIDAGARSASTARSMSVAPVQICNSYCSPYTYTCNTLCTSH